MINPDILTFLSYNVVEKEKHFLVRYELMKKKKRFIIKKNDYLNKNTINCEITLKYFNLSIFKYTPFTIITGYNKEIRDYIITYRSLDFLCKVFKHDTGNQYNLYDYISDNNISTEWDEMVKLKNVYFDIFISDYNHWLNKYMNLQVESVGKSQFLYRIKSIGDMDKSKYMLKRCKSHGMCGGADISW